MAKIKPIASYKYNYDDSLVPEKFNPSGQWFIILTLLVIAVVGTYQIFIYFHEPPAAFFAIGSIYLGLKLLSIKKYIHFYPRFLTIGTEVIYYENIEELDRSHLDSGKLEVIYRSAGKVRTFLFHKQSFPTNARKPEKIKANTEEKLLKTADRIQKHREYIDTWRKQHGFIESETP